LTFRQFRLNRLRGDYVGLIMPTMKITKTSVDEAAVPVSADAYYWDSDLRGFGLRVTPKGVRSYVVQYRLKGRPARRVTLGVHGSPWTPAKARTEAQDILIEVKRGMDPVEARQKKEREARTLGFESYLERFCDIYLQSKWKARAAGDAKRTLQLHVLPHFKGRSLPDLKASDVTAVLDKLHGRKALLRNTYALLRLLFNWAKGRGDLATSPMEGIPSPDKVKDRKRVLTPDEVLALWRVSYKLNSPFGAYVRLLITTLQRRNEVAGLPWKELDQASSTWRIDGERAKNDEDHLVPLNRLALADLDGLGWKRRGLVFSTTGTTAISGFSRLKARIDRLMLPVLQEIANRRAEVLGEPSHAVTIEPWRLHDIRRTGTTQMQALGIPIEVTERAINHKSGEASGIRAVYNLHEYQPEKRRAFDLWGAYLERVISGDDASNVVSLVKSAA
jgi:site-specific recombinase XerC